LREQHEEGAENIKEEIIEEHFRLGKNEDENNLQQQAQGTLSEI